MKSALALLALGAFVNAEEQAADAVQLTTSTIYTTSVSTVIYCPTPAPNCPEKTVYTTITKVLSTTVCPVTPTYTPKPPPTYTPAPPPPPPTYTPKPPPAPPATYPPAPPPPPPATYTPAPPPPTKPGTVVAPPPTKTAPHVVVTAAAAPLQRAGAGLAAVALAAALI